MASGPQEDISEEDELLDVMDHVWNLMSNEEKEWLNTNISKPPA